MTEGRLADALLQPSCTAPSRHYRNRSACANCPRQKGFIPTGLDRDPFASWRATAAIPDYVDITEKNRGWPAQAGHHEGTAGVSAITPVSMDLSGVSTPYSRAARFAS
jgi:hypothetical protein